ncbi:MAG TPA: bifunctional homocysteine S-methyltransferase/methylenetetrahydrofolate reductase [Candidatus Dormibacteraeota bacterium]|nr:bifunctional homocysteine S-methyltransferase/methylenetetrahydrofolate reductase [Candidatus Dormibacteraeota bacterium]
MAEPASGGLPRERFRNRLAAGPILVDGGMGTLLFSRGVPQRACLEELVVSHPEMVGAAHREYLEAGAELIETLSFGANRHRLAAWGLEGSVADLNRRAARIAREAREVSGRDALVGGSVGPLGSPARGMPAMSEATIRAAFREHIEGLLEGGADVIVLETFSDLAQLVIAVDEARKASDVPVIASLTFGEELRLADGSSPRAAAEALATAGADAIGVNCGAGPVACLDALGAMGQAVEGEPARSIMPNAGLPQRLEGRFVYAASPTYFGTVTPRLLAAGAGILGGCCGTTPEHIAEMRSALDALLAAGAAATVGAAATADVEPTQESPTEVADRRRQPSLVERATNAVTEGDAPPPTRLAQLLAAGRFVVSVEIDPPRSIRIDRTIDAARLLRDAGVDVVNVSDSAMARVRMSALSVAFGIQHDLDLECLVHCTTRDRNLMALESELLGAHALGVRNIIALTGDPPRIGDYPTGTGVWDVDSIGLIEILARLNLAEDPSGASIGQRAGFTIACALDSTAADSATEWDRLERKVEAGAHLVMTQPLYSVEQVESMLAEARRRFGPRGLPVPILLGVLPLVSARHAEFLHNEVPGITIADEARAAMRAAGERGSEVGIEMADRLLSAMEGEVAGTYIMPSFGRYEQCAELVRRIRTRHPAEPVAVGSVAASASSVTTAAVRATP